jgi:tetratricopeptide (TPR) repeat protein
MITLPALWLAAALATLPSFQPTDEACLALAKKIEASVAAGKGAWVDQNFDVDTMMDRVLRDAPGDEQTKQGFRAGLKKGFNLGKSTSAAMGASGSFTFLRLRTVNGRKQALFRLLMNGPFNYHDYVLEEAPQGGVRVVDIYIYLTGEFISQSFRRMYIAAMASEPGAVGKLVGNQNEYALALKKLQTMNQLTAQGKPAEALKVFHGLPESLQKEKNALVLRLQAGSKVSPKESMDALEALRKAYPGDPSIGVVSLDPLFLAKKYDEVIEAVDDLDKALGGDPFLHSFRASVYLEKGDLDKARASAKKSIEMDQALAAGYWALVSISLRAKTFRETVEWLNAIEKNLGVQFKDLTTVPIYAEFIKSPEYEEWAKSRKK